MSPARCSGAGFDEMADLVEVDIDGEGDVCDLVHELLAEYDVSACEELPPIRRADPALRPWHRLGDSGVPQGGG